MKIYNDDLFQLIRSMTMNEKRYFALMATAGVRKKKNKLLDLFQLINSQKHYNEEKVKAKFKTEKYLNNNLSVAKQDLTDLILKHMRSYKYRSDVIRVILTEIENAKYLRDKGLNKQVAHCLKKALKLCDEHNIGWYKSIVLKEMTSAYYRTRENISGDGEEQKEIYSNLLTESMINTESTKYESLKMELFHFNIKKGIVREKGDKEILDRVKNSPLFYNPPAIRSGNLSAHRAELRFFYFQLISDFRNMEIEMGNLVGVFKEYNLHRNMQYSYVATLLNQAILLLRLRNMDKAEQVFKEAEAFMIDGPSAMAVLQVRLSYVKTEYYYFRGEFDKAEEEKRKGDGLLRKLAVKSQLIIAYRADLLLAAARLRFAQQNYKEATRSLNELLYSHGQMSGNDVKEAGLLLQVLTTYEREEYELLSSQTKALYRHFLKKGGQHKVEAILLNYIRKNQHYNLSTRKKLPGLVELKEEITSATKKYKSELYAERNYGLLDWLESKINKMAMQEVLRSKYGN